jgi:glutamate-5-semialdehyde dehydrogenase
MARADSATRNRALTLIAAAIVRDADLLRAANQRDLDAAAANGGAGHADRLTLSDKASPPWWKACADRRAADPIGEISNMKFRPTGIQVGQMRVPLGVIGIIYEARPNVTVDAAGLCIKSGNATILRGGSEAIHCNRALAKLVRKAWPAPAAGRCRAGGRDHRPRRRRRADHHAAVRGRDRAARRQGPDRALMNEATVPMIKHLDGICHVYIDDKADIEKALDIGFNAKCHRYGTCNTMETLLVSRAIAPACCRNWPNCTRPSRSNCAPMRKPRHPGRRRLPASGAATEEDWSTEYLAAILSVKVVDGIDEAMEHINPIRPSTRSPSSPKTTAMRCASCAKSIRPP